MHAHREAILARLALIQDNLKEIDFKLNIYDDPDAAALVVQEQAVAQAEKIANGLPNPYLAPLN
ncbi:hypothetical protein LBR02_21220 [Levilactobacillus brevis]|nr:hypothetical protein LBR02_21220 [Levilactobacillus brevis]